MKIFPDNIHEMGKFKEVMLVICNRWFQFEHLTLKKPCWTWCPVVLIFTSEIRDLLPNNVQCLKLICSPLMIWKRSVNVYIVKIKFLKSKILYFSTSFRHLLTSVCICLLSLFHTWLQNTRKNRIWFIWVFPSLQCYSLSTKIACKYQIVFSFQDLARSKFSRINSHISSQEKFLPWYYK